MAFGTRIGFGKGHVLVVPFNIDEYIDMRNITIFFVASFNLIGALIEQQKKSVPVAAALELAAVHQAPVGQEVLQLFFQGGKPANAEPSLAAVTREVRRHFVRDHLHERKVH